MIAVQVPTGAMFVFLKALCARAYSRQQYKSERAQTVFRPLKQLKRRNLKKFRLEQQSNP